MFRARNTGTGTDGAVGQNAAAAPVQPLQAISSSTGISRRSLLRAGGVLGVGAAAVPLLNACGRSSGAASGGGAGAGGSYTMWAMSDTVHVMEHFAKQYKSTVNKDFDLRITEVPTGLSLRAKIISASAAGRLPDLLDLSMNYGSDFATYNMFEPLGGALPSDLATKAAMYKKVWNWADTKDIPGFEGEQHIFGVPYALSVFVPAYRVDFLKAVNAEFPKTWDELVEVGQKLTKAPSRYALSIPTSGDLMDEFHPFLMQAGATYVDTGLTKAFPDREAAYRGFEFYRDLSVKYGIAPKQAPDRFAGDPVQRLSSGQVAITTLSTLSINALQKSAPNLKFGPDGQWFAGKFWEGPGGPGGYFNANALHLRRGVKNVQAAVDFMVWLVQPERQLELYKQFNRPPINTDVWKQLADDPAFAIYKASIETSERQGGFKAWKLAEFVIDRGVERIVLGGEDVKAVVDETAKDMLQALQNA
ncbi:MAG: multiple sugar transport system substrate-binding protein [Kribbellaceae bacterium]|jgi:ABC-type glycerol-3-phosphate transport system substrate-binding protein|nr:multiple sugar transport system substrate-binding protein [Kribbellaceae bacterium]